MRLPVYTIQRSGRRSQHYDDPELSSEPALLELSPELVLLLLELSSELALLLEELGAGRTVILGSTPDVMTCDPGKATMLTWTTLPWVGGGAPDDGAWAYDPVRGDGAWAVAGLDEGPGWDGVACFPTGAFLLFVVVFAFALALVAFAVVAFRGIAFGKVTPFLGVTPVCTEPLPVIGAPPDPVLEPAGGDAPDVHGIGEYLNRSMRLAVCLAGIPLSYSMG